MTLKDMKSMNHLMVINSFEAMIFLRIFHGLGCMCVFMKLSINFQPYNCPLRLVPLSTPGEPNRSWQSQMPPAPATCPLKTSQNLLSTLPAAQVYQSLHFNFTLFIVGDLYRFSFFALVYSLAYRFNVMDFLQDKQVPVITCIATTINNLWHLLFSFLKSLRWAIQLVILLWKQKAWNPLFWSLSAARNL